MPTDRGYVIVAAELDERASVFVCMGLGKDGTPTQPYAVHKRAGEPVMEDGLVLEQHDGVKFCRELVQVYVPEESTKVHVSRPESDDTVKNQMTLQRRELRSRSGA